MIGNGERAAISLKVCNWNVCVLGTQCTHKNLISGIFLSLPLFLCLPLKNKPSQCRNQRKRAGDLCRQATRISVLSCNFLMNFQMTPGLLSFPSLPLPLKSKPFPGRRAAFSLTQCEDTHHRDEADQARLVSASAGRRQCWKGHSGPFIPNQVTSREILEPSPGSALDGRVKLTAISAHQMEHRERGGDSPHAYGQMRAAFKHAQKTKSGLR